MGVKIGFWQRKMNKKQKLHKGDFLLGINETEQKRDTEIKYGISK